MTGFNGSKVYAKQEDVYFDDGREIELLHYVYSRPNLDHLRGSPSNILAAIDKFGSERKYLMNVGSSKGSIVARLIEKTHPKVMVEVGAYIGYSAVLFGDAMRRSGGQQYICLEYNPEFAAVTSSLVDLAGLSSIVKVIVGAASTSLPRLHSAGELKKIDFLFLDHIKPAYLPDLKLCEALGLICPGTVLVADNVIKPGNPPYLEYVRSTVATKKQQREGANKEDLAACGDPSLVYESELIHSFEPTGIPDGVEITKCVGRQE